MWVCRACGSTVEDDDVEVCWSCGRPRSGDPAWSDLGEAEAAGQYATVSDRDEKIRVLAALQQGLRIVARHPIVLMGVLPSLIWEAFATIAGVPGGGFFASREDLGWQERLPVDLLVVPTVTGLTIALVHGVVRGAVSVADALAIVGRRLPRLLIVTALLNVPWYVADLPVNPVVLLPGLLATVYLTFRLAFSDAAIVIDDLGVGDALRRSWHVTRGNWWRTAALVFVFAPALGLWALLATPIAVIVADLTLVVLDAVLACAYLQRSGQLLSERLAQTPLGPLTLPSA